MVSWICQAPSFCLWTLPRLLPGPGKDFPCVFTYSSFEDTPFGSFNTPPPYPVSPQNLVWIMSLQMLSAQLWTLPHFPLQSSSCPPPPAALAPSAPQIYRLFPSLGLPRCWAFFPASPLSCSPSGICHSIVPQGSRPCPPGLRKGAALPSALLGLLFCSTHHILYVHVSLGFTCLMCIFAIWPSHHRGRAALGCLRVSSRPCYRSGTLNSFWVTMWRDEQSEV